MGLEPSCAQGAWRCAEVALRLPLDQTYYYLIPGDWPEGYGALRPGRLVFVPWGKREEIGCVLRVLDHPPETAHSLRCLLRPASPWYSMDPPLIELARWIASYYLCPLGEALEAVSFLGFSDVAIREESWVRIAPQWASRSAANTPAASGHEPSCASSAPSCASSAPSCASSSSSPASSSPSVHSPSAKAIRWIERSKFRLALIDNLDEAGGEMLASDALREADANAGHLRALIEAGAVLERRAPAPWRAFPQSADEAPAGAHGAASAGSPSAAPSDSPRALNPEQQFAFDRIAAALRERRFAAFLLQGVTGSGKTEVYLQAIQACLEQGRQAICLVPEIALTPQTLQRFQARFGSLAAVRHGGPWAARARAPRPRHPTGRCENHCRREIGHFRARSGPWTSRC